MTFDRGQDDVVNAARIRKEKVQQFQELTQDDINTLERGMLTINVLNRIENKQNELKTLLNEIGYWNTPISNKTWNYTQIFDIREFTRLINNANILRTAFFTYKTTPNTPPITYHYTTLNNLEQILYDINNMIKDVKNLYKECGAYECGE